MARYLSGIKKQLQEVSDLFRDRYGIGSEISEEAVKTLAWVARLERDFLRLNDIDGEPTVAELESSVVSRPV